VPASEGGEGPPPDESGIDWDESTHTRAENVDHEEMRGTGERLKDNLSGLTKRAKLFFNQDANKDGFLAGADVPRGTLDLLDINTDLAVSFDEWTHGFAHVSAAKKLKVFKTYYGETYGDTLPSDWAHRDLHHMGQAPEDDRHEEHPMDAEASTLPPPPVTTEPGEMSDAELNAALDKDFIKMDADGDGAVTLAEYKAWDVGNSEVESDYNVLDRNHDGRLTRVELSGTDDHSSYQSHEEHEKQHNELHDKHLKKKQEAIEKAKALGQDEAAAAKAADDESDMIDGDEELEESQLQAEFDRMDTDNDGKVSEDEYVVWAELANPGDTSARHNFRLIDRNKSEKLTFRELFPTSVRKKDIHYDPHAETAAADTPSDPPPGHDDHDEDDDDDLNNTKKTDPQFDLADKDGNGKLSAAEADAIGLRDEEGSVKADVDKNGFVDRIEFMHATLNK